MKANAERIEGNTVQLEIEVEAEQFSRAVDQAFRKLVKDVSIPGFRKGKTPRPLFERYYGKEALYEEAMEAIVPVAYYNAVKETGIEPIDQPQVEVVQAEEGMPVLFKATVQVKPEVNLGQYKELEVPRIPVEVKESDIDNELKILQNKHARLVTIEEGAVEAGHIAVIDFLGKIEGVPFEGGEGKDFSLEIGSRSFIPGFEEQVVGISIGETKDIQVTFPEDYRAENLAGKEATFTVTVKGLKRKDLADIDDEFAKDVSDFETLEELKNDISNRLVQAAENRAKHQTRQEIVAKVVDGIEVDVPEVMVEKQLQEMVTNLERRLMMQGLNVEQYCQFTNTTIEEMKTNMQVDALWSVKMNLAMDKIAKLENITATEEDIKEEVGKMAQQYGQEPDKIMEVLNKEDRMDFIKDGIIREKTLQLLADQAKYVEEPEKPEEKEEEPEKQAAE